MSNVALTASDGKAWHIQAAVRAPKVGHQPRAGASCAFRSRRPPMPRSRGLTSPGPNEEQPYYDLIDPRYRNLPLAPYPLAAHARVTYRGVPLEWPKWFRPRSASELGWCCPNSR